MRRIVIITAALLVSALGAQAASRHPAHRQAASSACMARQAHIADILEQTGAAGSLPAFQQLAKDLRTRCLPQDHNPADYDPFNTFYVDPHANDTP